MIAVDTDLKVQMRPCAVSGASHRADDLSLGHPGPQGHVEAVHVGIEGRYPVPMVDDHRISIPVIVLPKDDHPIANGFYGIPRGSGKIHTGMKSAIAPDGMNAIAVARCDATAHGTNVS